MIPAYIDPGAGTVLLQLVAGAVIGAALFFRRGLGGLLGFFRRTPPTPPAPPPAEPPKSDAP